eukprot:scaffold1392_cov269-Chaetoceros_neogracile.AAC.23
MDVQKSAWDWTMALKWGKWRSAMKMIELSWLLGLKRRQKTNYQQFRFEGKSGEERREWREEEKIIMELVSLSRLFSVTDENSFV